MRNYVIVLTGNTSELSCDIYPPIDLLDGGEYVVGLLSFDSYNTIANIKQGSNDSFTMCYLTRCLPVTIPQGCYEVTDIQNVMQERMMDAYLTKVFGVTVPAPEVKLTANAVTNRLRLESNYTIDFDVRNSLANRLGFRLKKYEGNMKHDAPDRVDINPSSTICVECSIADGAYKNGRKTHDIFQFVADVPPGYALNEHPNNIIYHPINSTLIDNVTLKVRDSRGELVEFGGEEITIRLHIKQWA